MSRNEISRDEVRKLRHIAVTPKQYRFMRGIHRVTALLGRAPTARDLIKHGVATRISSVTSMAYRLRQHGLLALPEKNKGYQTVWSAHFVAKAVKDAIEVSDRELYNRVDVVLPGTWKSR